MALFSNPFFVSNDRDVELAYTTGVAALSQGNYQSADERFRQAAGGDHISAFYNLALMNGAGLVQPYDLDFAIDCFTKAAAGEHAAAKTQLWMIEAADRGGFGTRNLAKLAQSSEWKSGRLNHILMMCAARFFDVVCSKYAAAKDVIAYELDAASMSDEPAVQRFVRRTGIDTSFYESGMERNTSGSAADQLLMA